MKSRPRHQSSELIRSISLIDCGHARRPRVFALLLTIAVISGVIGLSSCSGYTTAASVGGSGGGNGSPGDPGAGVLSAGSTSVSFGSVAVGSTGTQSVTVTNTGTATVNITSAVITGAAFTVIGGNPASSVPVGQSVTVQIQFAPTTSGAVTGTLTVTSDASNSPLTIPLSGTGTQPVLTISPASLNFNNVPVGQTSSQTVTLTNTGNSNLVINLATISGTGFTMSSLGLPKTITAGSNISFSVQFSPTSTSGATGIIQLTDNAPGSPQTVTMTGSAVATGSSLSANPGSFNFNNVVVGSSSPQTFTLTNSGNATITINQINTTGTGYSTSGLAPNQTIAAGATASFTGTFAPTTTGTVPGSITITSTATNPTLTISLSGTGTRGALTANPPSINFGALVVGSSGSVPVTLSNTGTAPISITAHSITGAGFTLTGWSAPASLNPGQTTTFTVTFAPTSGGSASGSVSISSNAPGSPLLINLSGSGTVTQAQMTIGPASVTFNNVNVGGNATQNVTLTNTGTAALNITAASVTGPGYTMSLTAPKTINAGANSVFTVTFKPPSSGSAAGSISISSNASGSPATIPLSGTGMQAQIAASPTSVAFSNAVVGNSNSQPVTIRNNGNALLTFSSIVTAGTGMSINGLTTSTKIAAGGSVTFNAIFTPTSATTINGSVKLTTNGTPSPLTINLTGTGVAATRILGASPTSLAFGTLALNSSSQLTSTLTNNGNSNVTISGVTVTGAGFSVSGVSSNTILTPGQTATLMVTFAPTIAGAVNGASVNVASNATGSPTTVALSGTGQTASSRSVALTWSASPTSGISGYNVFRATSSGGYGPTPLNPSPVSALTYTDTTVVSGLTYFYVVTAVNSAGNSPNSNEVPASIP